MACDQFYWMRPDGVRASREDMLMVLADLQYILIKAKYTMDVAESRYVLPKSFPFVISGFVDS